LSEASPDDVNRLWAGLGYYRRAKSLQNGSKTCVQDFSGLLPDNVSDLLKISGIGPYTAGKSLEFFIAINVHNSLFLLGAIASIAFNKVEPLVDGNVIRVLSRLRAINEEYGTADMDKYTWALARQLVDPISPGIFNQVF
jgi:A/G-specific adenine glycosylase